MEPSLPLHLQDQWGFRSDRVGLVYMAALVPALICAHTLHRIWLGRELTSILASPLSGLFSDRIGSDYVTSACLLLALPWWIILPLRRSLGLFIACLALQCKSRGFDVHTCSYAHYYQLSLSRGWFLP